MRTELAVGQFADLVNDAGRFPTLDEVLDVSRRKSGNYTVRRPLEIGAALAGCDDRMLAALGGYGDAVGEAFQLRDDLLGIFGSTGGHRQARRRRPVRAQGHQRRGRRPSSRRRSAAPSACRADDPQRELDEADIGRWRTLIVATGAVEWIEQMIDERFTARSGLARHRRIDASVRSRWPTWPRPAPNGPRDADASG